MKVEIQIDEGLFDDGVCISISRIEAGIQIPVIKKIVLTPDELLGKIMALNLQLGGEFIDNREIN